MSLYQLTQRLNFEKQTMYGQKGLEAETLNHGWTKWHCINQSDLDWIQLVLAKSINGYYPKLIDEAKEVGILKPGYKVEERSVKKIDIVCNLSYEYSTLNYGSMSISIEAIFFETSCAWLRRP